LSKTATLNLRVNPEVKKNAEEILDQLGIPMATAIDMYLKQIALMRGIPFSVTLPSMDKTVNADTMTRADLCAKLDKGYLDVEKENVVDAESAFADFLENH